MHRIHAIRVLKPLMHPNSTRATDTQTRLSPYTQCLLCVDYRPQQASLPSQCHCYPDYHHSQYLLVRQNLSAIRQHINENKIAVLFTAEPVGCLPIAPVPFTLTDAERCLGQGGNWDDLQEERQETDVKTVAERDGVSERTAYRRTAEKKKQSRVRC